MRENRTYGLEGGESGATGLPYPYHGNTVACLWDKRLGNGVQVLARSRYFAAFQVTVD